MSEKKTFFIITTEFSNQTKNKFTWMPFYKGKYLDDLFASSSIRRHHPESHFQLIEKTASREKKTSYTRKLYSEYATPRLYTQADIEQIENWIDPLMVTFKNNVQLIIINDQSLFNSAIDLACSICHERKRFSNELPAPSTIEEIATDSWNQIIREKQRWERIFIKLKHRPVYTNLKTIPLYLASKEYLDARPASHFHIGLETKDLKHDKAKNLLSAELASQLTTEADSIWRMFPT